MSWLLLSQEAGSMAVEFYGQANFAKAPHQGTWIPAGFAVLVVVCVTRESREETTCGAVRAGRWRCAGERERGRGGAGGFALRWLYQATATLRVATRRFTTSP